MRIIFLSTVLFALFNTSVFAGVTRGNIDLIDSEYNTVVIDDEFFHYNSETKNRTKDWHPQEGDDIVVIWKEVVDDDENVIRLVTSFRKDVPPQQLPPRRHSGAAAQLNQMNNPGGPAAGPGFQLNVNTQPNKRKPIPANFYSTINADTPAFQVYSWNRVEALKEEYAGRRVFMYARYPELDKTWVREIPLVEQWLKIVNKIQPTRADIARLDELVNHTPDHYNGMRFTDRRGDRVSFAFFRDKSFVDTVLSLPFTDWRATQDGPLLAIEGLVIRMDTTGVDWIGLVIDKMEIVHSDDIEDWGNPRE